MKQEEIYKHYINMLSDGHVHSILCYSKAGLGKTYTTINVLKSLGLKYTYTSGVTTAVSLYKLLYETNNSVLILDDIETLFQDDKIVNLLKACLWDVDGNRMVTYSTSSKVLEDYPSSFSYTGKIIILANEIKGKYDETFKALMSRCLKYELCYSFEDIILMSEKIVKKEESLNDDQRKQVIDIVKKNIQPEHNFNFRLLQRLMSFVKYNPDIAEMLFMQSIDVDSDKVVMISILRKNIPVAKQIDEFRKETGQSRMTFFRRKKQLKAEGLI